MIKTTKLTFADMLELRNSHVEVSEHVFIMLADKNEIEDRKALSKRYGGYSNIHFFSDGSVFMDGSESKGATGWVSSIPPRFTYENSEQKNKQF